MGAALAYYEAKGDRRRIALALLRTSNIEIMDGHEAEGYALAEQALEHARAIGDRALEGYALTQMAIGSVNIERGQPLLEAGLEALRHAGAINRIPGVLSTVAFGLLRLGAYDEAEALHRQAVYAVNQTRSRYLTALVEGNRALDVTDARSLRRGSRGLRRRAADRPRPGALHVPLRGVPRPRRRGRQPGARTNARQRWKRPPGRTWTGR